MSTSDQILEHGIIRPFLVAAASTATRGLCGTFTAEKTARDATAGENASVLFLETKAAGEYVQGLLLNSGAVGIMKASGTVTAGQYLKVGSDGVENVTLGGGSTVAYVVGKALQTGVDGDYVGVMTGCFAGVSA
jgi:hypothetical protein